MKRWQRGRNPVRKYAVKTALATAALVMIAGISMGRASAYFTTYATAKGEHTISLGTTTRITEEFSRWTKHVSILNTGKKECYVRVKVFAGSTYGISCVGNGWRGETDGYWYYGPVVPAGGATEVLDVAITLPETTATDDEGNPLPYTEDFNVVVIQECTAVLYREDGTAYADWGMLLDSQTDRYDGKEEGLAHE